MDDSVYKDKQIDTIKEVLVDLKNEQISTRRQLKDLTGDIKHVEKGLKTITKDKTNINIAISTNSPNRSRADGLARTSRGV